MKYKIISFWLVTYGVLFTFLQAYARFYFHYMEQNQLFQNSWPYIFEHLLEPGGLAFVISGFLLQFFAMPYAGAGITAAILTGAGWLTYGIVKRIAPQSGLLIACLLPVVALMLIYFNENYLPFGTIAYLLTLMALYFVLSVKKFSWRLILHMLATIALFYLAGSVYVLYAITATVYELLNRPVRSYLALSVLFEALLIGLSSVYFSVYTAYRFTFLPDNYFHYKWLPGSLIYLSWVCLLLIVVFACVIRKRQVTNENKRMRMIYTLVQVVLVSGFCWWGILVYGIGEKSKTIELDYYSRTEQWDRILERCKGQLTDYLSICYANMALAQKGELANKIFSYDQAGIEGLIIPWNKTAFSSTLLSDVYFTMNDVALSQKMAFEGFVINQSPRMLKRLVQTNLIYGAYPVAEKYISILENMYCYHDWAKAHREFLYHDTAVEQDVILGSKRKSLLKANYLSKIDGLDVDLQQLAGNNPSDHTAIDYAGVMYLLVKDMESFRKMLETYHHTDVLPTLPVSFQEAILVISLKDMDYWKRYDISEAIVQRFAEFMKVVSTNKDNPGALSVSMRPSYGDTYWYYYMFK